MALGLIEFLLVAGLVLGFAVWQLWPLHRDKRRAERERRRDGPAGS